MAQLVKNLSTNRICKRCRFNPWFGKIPWGRKCISTLVFLPGKFHGQRSLSGYSSCSHKESEMTEFTNTHRHTRIHTESLWDWNKNTFPSTVATAEFSNIADILSASFSPHHLLGFEIAHLDFSHLH